MYMCMIFWFFFLSFCIYVFKVTYVSSLRDQKGSFKLRAVNPEEVNKCIKTLRNDCSTGYDNIPVSFIKPVAKYLESPLTYIINNFIATSAFPNQWKIARISPIPKVTNPSFFFFFFFFFFFCNNVKNTNNYKLMQHTKKKKKSKRKMRNTRKVQHKNTESYCFMTRTVRYRE